MHEIPKAEQVIQLALLGAIAAFNTADASLLTAIASGKLDTAAQNDFVVGRVLPNINSTSAADNDQAEVLFFGPITIKSNA